MLRFSTIALAVVALFALSACGDTSAPTATVTIVTPVTGAGAGDITATVPPATSVPLASKEANNQVDPEAIDALRKALLSLDALQSGRVESREINSGGPGYTSTLEIQRPYYARLVTIYTAGDRDETIVTKDTQYHLDFVDGKWRELPPDPSSPLATQPFTFLVLQGATLDDFLRHINHASSMGTETIDGEPTQLYRYTLAGIPNGNVPRTIWISKSSGLPLKFEVKVTINPKGGKKPVETTTTVQFFDFNAPIGITTPVIP